MFFISYPNYNYRLHAYEQVGIEVPTREEMFGVIRSLVREGMEFNRPYFDWERLEADIQVTGKDTVVDWFTKKSRLRRLTVKEDGRYFDIRPFLPAIKLAKPYKKPYTPRGEAHNLVGYGPVQARRPSYKGHLKQRAREMVDFQEWGILPSLSSRNWWWYDTDEFVHQTRSWKDKTKSRKQWGKKKLRPVQRGYADKEYGLPEEAVLGEA